VGVLYTTLEGVKPSRLQRRTGPAVFLVHSFLFVRHGKASLAAAIALYAAVLIAFGDRLAISSNYFVLIPVIVAALSGGLFGGLAAGALGLPANLLLFGLIGHPEFSPASKPIAEASGLVVGLTLGYLSEYFRSLAEQIRIRAEAEDELRRTLVEKELLLKELHHRVKNNLNVIKSLVQLQRNRSADPAFVAASDELVNRVLALSLVHDQLYGSDSPLVEPGPYLKAIANNVSKAFSERQAPIAVSVEAEVGGRLLPADIASSLGLVANEALTNAVKHSSGAAGGAVSMSLRIEGGEYELRVIDDGPGPRPGTDDGLGMKIVRALASQLGGRVRLGPGPSGGALLEIRWPLDGDQTPGEIR